MKKYTISFNKITHDKKPSGKEIAKISNSLYKYEMEYKELAHKVGKCGCTFSPAIYDGKRKKDNYAGQQLIALDFDDGVSFAEIKERAELYMLPILFAYKTFSYTEEHEKFRVVFALSDIIFDLFTSEVIISMFMEIFKECDKACKDGSRMFFGGSGLLELANEPAEITFNSMIVSFVNYMNDRYGDDHYKREIRKFYQSIGVKCKNTIPVVEDDKFVYSGIDKTFKNKTLHNSDDNDVNKKGRREVTRNFDWNALYDRCLLYRKFVDGSEYYYYPELFIIATNFINIEKGKKKFMEILNSENNAKNEAYHTCNWQTTLRTIIEMDYRLEGCESCPYADECMHSKNMILTAKPTNSIILQTKKKEYVSVEEAEEDLRVNFYKAVLSINEGVHIIKAQTGIGKTNLYLDYILKSDNKFIIAVPTHNLKMEIYNKAVYKGISDIAYTPEMPELTQELDEKIKHIYNIGAGEYAIKILRDTFHNMKPEDHDYKVLSDYLESVEKIKDFEGHIITTHDRLLYMRNDNDLLSDREVIIDEDIIRTMLSIGYINNKEIQHMLDKGLFTQQVTKKFKSIIKNKGYRRYDYREDERISITNESLPIFDDINADIVGLSESCYTYNNGTETYFVKRKWLPCKKVIIMSATANEEIYKMLTHYDVHFYSCKMAHYMGELKLCSKHSFSRNSLEREGIIDYIKENIGDDIVITVKAFEKEFNTKYHYGAVEGLNCLEGKNISIVGLPNVNEVVYKLYGMITGVDVEKCNISPRRIEYNGYNFYVNTFENKELRAIQLWMLESLIEQAVGRARLLRFDCTVKLFARFPVDQAIIE